MLAVLFCRRLYGPIGGGLSLIKKAAFRIRLFVLRGSPSADAEAPDISGATAPENLLAQHQICKQQLCFTISAQAPLPRVLSRAALKSEDDLCQETRTNGARPTPSKADRPGKARSGRHAPRTDAQQGQHTGKLEPQPYRLPPPRVNYPKQPVGIHLTQSRQLKVAGSSENWGRQKSIRKGVGLGGESLRLKIQTSSQGQCPYLTHLVRSELKLRVGPIHHRCKYGLVDGGRPAVPCPAKNTIDKGCLAQACEAHHSAVFVEGPETPEQMITW